MRSSILLLSVLLLAGCPNIDPPKPSPKPPAPDCQPDCPCHRFITGEVTYIGPWTKNGDGNFIVTRTFAIGTFAVFDVVIVGYPSNLPETKFELRSVEYASELLHHRVSIEGRFQGNRLIATLVREL